MLQTIEQCENKYALAHLKMLPTNYLLTNFIYIRERELERDDLELNNQQGLICHKIQSTTPSRLKKKKKEVN